MRYIRYRVPFVEQAKEKKSWSTVHTKELSENVMFHTLANKQEDEYKKHLKGSSIASTNNSLPNTFKAINNISAIHKPSKDTVYKLKKTKEGVHFLRSKWKAPEIKKSISPVGKGLANNNFIKRRLLNKDYYPNSRNTSLIRTHTRKINKTLNSSQCLHTLKSKKQVNIGEELRKALNEKVKKETAKRKVEKNLLDNVNTFVKDESEMSEYSDSCDTVIIHNCDNDYSLICDSLSQNLSFT